MHSPVTARWVERPTPIRAARGKAVVRGKTESYVKACSQQSGRSVPGPRGWGSTWDFSFDTENSGSTTDEGKAE